MQKITVFEIQIFENPKLDKKTLIIKETSQNEVLRKKISDRLVEQLGECADFGCCEQFEGYEDGLLSGLKIAKVKKLYKVYFEAYDAVSYYLKSPLKMVEKPKARK